MNATLNFTLLLISGTLMWWLYVLSVSPAQLERRWGPKAYPLCGWFRTFSGIFMGEVFVHYWLYRRYPLSIGLPERYSWPYAVNIILAILIGIPAIYLLIRGMLDAGSELAVPDKANDMYGGIYERIRHPQLAAEVPLWFVLALLFNSPFLTLFSIVWLPVWFHWAKAEEKDLLLRFGDAYKAYMGRTGMFWGKRTT